MSHFIFSCCKYCEPPLARKLSVAICKVLTRPSTHILPASTSTISQRAAYAASNCITNGTTFCHSLNGAGQWLQVDLGSQRAIGKVVVLNRLDCCQDRIGTCLLASYSLTFILAAMCMHAITPQSSSRIASNTQALSLSLSIYLSIHLSAHLYAHLFDLPFCVCVCQSFNR